MTESQFKSWRTEMGYSVSQAADALGIPEKTAVSYETGCSDEGGGAPASIPLHVELACAALAAGITVYDPEAHTR